MRDEMKFQITISHSFIFFLFSYDSDIIRFDNFQKLLRDIRSFCPKRLKRIDNVIFSKI